jgi:hypothetical protein
MGVFWQGVGVYGWSGFALPQPLPLAGGELAGIEVRGVRASNASPPAGGRGSRGGLVRERALNGFDDALQVTQNIVVPEADHPPALGFEIARAGFIISGLGIVLTAIDFNDQLFRSGGEVGDIRADGYLPVEANACDLAPR